MGESVREIRKNEELSKRKGYSGRPPYGWWADAQRRHVNMVTVAVHHKKGWMKGQKKFFHSQDFNDILISFRSLYDKISNKQKKIYLVPDISWKLTVWHLRFHLFFLWWYILTPCHTSRHTSNSSGSWDIVLTRKMDRQPANIWTDNLFAQKYTKSQFVAFYLHAWFNNA